MSESSTQDVVVVQYHKLAECSAIEQAAADEQVLLAQQIQQVRVCLTRTDVVVTVVLHAMYAE